MLVDLCRMEIQQQPPQIYEFIFQSPSYLCEFHRRVLYPFYFFIHSLSSGSNVGSMFYVRILLPIRISVTMMILATHFCSCLMAFTFLAMSIFFLCLQSDARHDPKSVTISPDGVLNLSVPRGKS